MYLQGVQPKSMLTEIVLKVLHCNQSLFQMNSGKIISDERSFCIALLFLYRTQWKVRQAFKTCSQIKGLIFAHHLRQPIHHSSESDTPFPSNFLSICVLKFWKLEKHERVPPFPQTSIEMQKKYQISFKFLSVKPSDHKNFFWF